MRSLRYLNTILTILAVLLSLQLYTMWMRPAASSSPAWPDFAGVAHAQEGIPNAGAQRREMIDLLKAGNKRLDELTDLFRSGRARIQVEAGADRDR